MKLFTFTLTLLALSSSAFAAQSPFTGVGGLKPVEAWACEPNNWQFRNAYRQARGQAENMAVVSGYDNCRDMNPTYYYRDKAKECVIIVQIMCYK